MSKTGVVSEKPRKNVLGRFIIMVVGVSVGGLTIWSTVRYPQAPWFDIMRYATALLMATLGVSIATRN